MAPTITTLASSSAPFWQQAPVTILLSAATSALVGWFMAGVLARRQETAKSRLLAEATIREAVLRMRSDVLHVVAAAPFAIVNQVEVPRLQDAQLDAFAEDVVNAAAKLSDRCQEPIRALLVELLGEARVRMAEEIGPTSARLRADGQIGMANAGRAGWVVTELIPAQVDFIGGALKLFADNPLPERKDALNRQLDALLTLVSGRVGLSGRESLETISARLAAEGHQEGPAVG